MKKINMLNSSELTLKYEQQADRLREMDSSEERTAQLKAFLADLEKVILDITGDVLDYKFILRRELTPDQLELLDELLGLRCWALNTLFDEHCSEEEVRRFSAVNSKLYGMTQRMYERVNIVKEHLQSMPMHEEDDDVMVEAKLCFWEDRASSVLELEDDGYYGSDFTRMIILLSIIDRDYKCYDEIESVFTSPKIENGRAIMTDDIQNDLDDDVSWGEGYLNHPKFSDIIICHAVHDICTHKNYSIPDLLRMNTFEVSVEVKIQQIQDQDGARCFWTEDYSIDQIKAKLLAESEHRPAGVSKADFLKRRADANGILDINSDLEDFQDLIYSDLDIRKL